MSPGEPLVNGERGLRRIADFCTIGLERTGVDAMTVTFANAFSGLELLHATDGLAERVAQLEVAVGQGPNTEAVSSGMPAAADDLQSPVAGHRWPLYAAEAVTAGVRGVQAYPILFASGSLGAVGLYSQEPSRLSSEQHRHATDITELIGLALVDPEAVASIGVGLRMTVHQAAWMVMQQAGISIPDALLLLRTTAFTEDRLVTDLAADVIAGRRRFEKTETIDE
jgi:hypothetical protein